MEKKPIEWLNEADIAIPYAPEERVACARQKEQTAEERAARRQQLERERAAEEELVDYRLTVIRANRQKQLVTDINFWMSHDMEAPFSHYFKHYSSCYNRAILDAIKARVEKHHYKVYFVPVSDAEQDAFYLEIC